MSGTSAAGNLSGKEWNVCDRKNFADSSRESAAVRMESESGRNGAFGVRRTAAGFLWFMKQGGN